MRSRRWKLALALLLVIVISVGLTAFLINRSTTSEFDYYIEQGRQYYVNLAGEGLSLYYQEQEGWAGVDGLRTFGHGNRTRFHLGHAPRTVFRFDMPEPKSGLFLVDGNPLAERLPVEVLHNGTVVHRHEFRRTRNGDAIVVPVELVSGR